MASLLGACVRGLRCGLSRFVCFITISVYYFVYYIRYICAGDFIVRAPSHASVCVGGRAWADMGRRYVTGGGGVEGFGG